MIKLGTTRFRVAEARCTLSGVLLKNDQNFRKHGVSFEEAEGVFYDLNSVTFFDETHSIEEERYIVIGFSFVGRLLLVVYTERGSQIRIVNARRCSISEAKSYE